MRTWLRRFGIVLLVLVIYLLVWPVPVQPVAWRAPAFGGFAGPYARNERLASERLVSVAPEVGPEHIVFGPDGKLYTGVLSGAVLRMNPDGSGRENVWRLHRRAAELGGHLRTGLEDTFYLPDGCKAGSNGELIDAIVRMARAAGRECATPAEARTLLHLAG